MNPPEPTPVSTSAGDVRDDPLLASLNPSQREAVVDGDGAVLVLAGAGSGKTRVITHRIAHLVRARGVDPREIVAVTFTNKAAGEMRERVERLLGAPPAGAWIGTFHAMCLRMLRTAGHHVGLEPGFNVYDTDDQLALVRRLLREERDEDTRVPARPFLSSISHAKNSMRSPSQVEARAFHPEAKLRAKIYARYEEALRLANAADFDDLLLRALELLDAEEHPDLRERYARQCRFLLVDEYQDTNRPQYLLVRALASHHHNVFVVGDEDQSIYRFRGAEIRNILDFEADHPGAKVIKLEQNYRSTAVILEAAGGVIACNRSRKGKRLWTENERGDPIERYHAPDDRAEASWVARRVRDLEPEVPYEKMAVLYRTNAQSRQFEEMFRRDRIPHQVVGSVQFYQRKEIKDVLAYLKLAANPADDVSFRRIVNTPPRGIGQGTLRTLDDLARERRIPLLEAAAEAERGTLFPARSHRSVSAFRAMIADLGERASNEPVAALITELIRRTELGSYLEKVYPGEGEDRMDNVRALVSAAVEYEKESDEPSLEGFLDRSALVSDADDVGARPGVTLMTIHCAKGLEFDTVFLAGLEENLFPHARSNSSEDELEEERRLCYVAMTRARRRLLLSHAAARLVQGVPVFGMPSRFLEEIPGELIEDAGPGPGRSIAESTAIRRSGGSSAARAARRGRSSEPAGPLRGAAVEDAYPIGARVRHPMFGPGQVLDREGSGKTLKLTIRFTTHGKKKILPAYTSLEPLSG